MEDRETPRMRKYGESKTTRIMMATAPHVTSGSGLRKFRAEGFLFDRVHKTCCYKTALNHTKISCRITLNIRYVPQNQFYVGNNTSVRKLIKFN